MVPVARMLRTVNELEARPEGRGAKLPLQILPCAYSYGLFLDI